MSNPIIPPPSNRPPRDPADILRNLPTVTPSRTPQPTPPSPPPSNIWQDINRAREEQQQNQPAVDWDPLWRPVQSFFDVLTAGGVGTINTVDKGIKALTSTDPGVAQEYIIGSMPGVGDIYNAYRVAKGQKMVGQGADWRRGFAASFTSNSESENYVWGSDLIENATDAFGARFDPNYVDREDNVNPWLKAGAGFVLDVGLDPVTYLPGGIIASGVKGGYRAAQAAKGLGKIPAAAKGIVKGTPGADLKFGRWTGAVKPVGLEQWRANRAVQQIDKIAAKAKIRPEQAMWASTRNLAKQGISPDDAAKYLNREAEAVIGAAGDDAARAAAQANYRTDWTGASVEALGRQVDVLSKNVEDFFEARRIQGQAQAYTRQATMQAAKQGASLYRNMSKEGKKAYDQKIYEDQVLNLAAENAQIAFYAGIKGMAAETSTPSDPFMRKVTEEITNAFTIGEYTGTAGDQALTAIDGLYGATPGTSKGFIQTHYDRIVNTTDDFTVDGISGNKYQFSQLLDSFLNGTDIGLAPQEANIFGRQMAEFMALSHDVRPTVAPEAAAAKITAETPSAVQEPLEAAVRASEDVPGPQNLPDVAPERVLQKTANTSPEGTLKMLWDEAGIREAQSEVRRLNKTITALDSEIDNIYTATENVSDYVVAGKRRWLPPTKGTLTSAMLKGNIDAVIDTRPVPYITGEELAHFDKTRLKPELEQAGIAYHALGQVTQEAPRNKAIHLTGSPTYAAIAGDVDFERGIDEIVEQLGDARRVAILVFEGAATFNKRQQLVAQALQGRGIAATVILQRGVKQGRDALDIIAQPLVEQADAARGALDAFLLNAAEITVDNAGSMAETVFRASAMRQLDAARKIMTEGDKDAWVGNIEGLLTQNARAYGSVGEEIAARSNILTTMIASHQGEAAGIVEEMLAAGGAKAETGDIELFFRSVFGSPTPVAESYVRQPGTRRILGEVDMDEARGGATLLGEAAEEFEFTDADVVFRVIRVLANLKTEIPGYTDRARAIVGQLESGKKVRETFGGTTAAEEAFDEISWVRRTYAPAFRENPGAHINIFGDVVEGGDIAVSAEMDRVIEAVGRNFIADASAPPLVANEEVARVFAQVSGVGDSATANLYGVNTPILRNVPSAKYGAEAIKEMGPVQQRWPVGLDIKATGKVADDLRAELGAPWKSTELNDIYDHVAGFAREPIGSISSWVHALTRVAFSTSPARFQARELLKTMGIPAEKASVEMLNASQTAALSTNKVARETYDAYKKLFNFGQGDDGSYGVDIFGRMFRDATPQNVRSAKTPYSSITDPTDKYFGDKLYRMSQDYEESVGGITFVNLEKFAEKLTERYGYVRAQELMPMIRQIEAIRIDKQARQIIDNIDEAMTAEMTPDQLRAIANDPLYAPLADIEKLPDEIRSGVIASLAARNISTVRSSFYSSDPRVILEHLVETSQIKNMRYKLAERTLKFSGGEQQRIHGLLHQPKVVQRILELVEGGEVINTGRSPVRETLGAAEEAATRRGGEAVKARSDFIGRWFGREGSTVGEGGARRAKEGQATIRETMDIVRAEDMGEAFWVGLGGDSIVKWDPTQDPKVDDFVHGVLKLLKMDPVVDRPVIQDALMNASARSEGGAESFQISHLLEEISTSVRNAATTGLERDLTRGETIDIIINGKPLAEGSRIIAKKVGDAARAKNPEELIELFTSENPWIRVDRKTVQQAMAILEEAPYANASAIPAQIRSKNVLGIFTAKSQQMAAAVKAFNDLVIPNGELITQRASQLGTQGIDDHIASFVNTAQQNISRVQNDSARNLIVNAAAESNKQSIKKMGKKGNREYTQYTEVQGGTEIRKVIETKFPPKSPESWNAQMLARAQAQASLRAAGVFQTTILHGKNNLYKVDLDAAHNWAYLDFMDTYRALIEYKPMHAMLREALELKTIGGKTFPQTLIPEMGVYAMQLSKTKLGVPERALMLYDYAKSRLSDMKGYGAWADALDPVKGEGFADAFMAAMVARLTRENVTNKLFETHLNNGAAALRVAEENSRQIIEPVVNKLLAVGRAIPRSHGAVADALNQSITDLRNELTKRGFGRTSAEAIISSHALQKLHVDQFDTFDINGARYKYRMDRAVHVGKTMADELSPEQVAKRQEYVAAQRRRAMPDRMRLDAIRKAANEERAKLASESMPVAREMAVADVVRTAQRAIDENDAEGIQLAYEQAINISEHIHHINMTLQASFRGNRERFDAIEAALEFRRPVRETSEEALQATPQSDRLNLAGQADTSRTAKVHQPVSGRAGQQDLKAKMAGVENALDGQANIGEKVVEAATRGIMRILGDKTGEATTAWTNRLIRATFGKNRYDMLGEEPNAELVQYGRDLLKAWNVILDTTENGLIARSGLDTSHINKYIARGPMGFETDVSNALKGIEKEAKGIVRFARLPDEYMGWEIEKMLPDYIDNLLDPEKGARSALQAFKGLNYGLHHAAVIPDIGAQFSAEFGHRSFGFLTVKDALAAGFKQIKTGRGTGTLSEWLDPYQAYPPDLIRQMANAQKFLDILDRNPLQGNKIVRALDKITSFTKSSLTVWRPGHHVVSAGGDALMNLLDGVVNPYRYYQAIRIMRSNGQLKRGTFVGRDANAAYGRFTGEYSQLGDAAKRGVEVRVGGKTRRISDEALYKMLDDAGGLINNNTAEDLLAIGDEISLSGGMLSRMFRPIVRANRGLGEFSARRDNVLRLAHAVDIVSKRSFSSVADMRDVLLRELVEWHPTLQSLSGAERVYARRIFFFYTWMRNAANKVFETIVEDPRYLTVMPKLNYELSTIGGDPQTVGQPMPNDPRLPEFASRNILGPHWYDENGNIQGVTVNAPQLDIFQELLGKISVDPNMSFSRNVKENATMLYRENTIGMFSPIPTLAIQSFTGEKYQEYGMVPIQDPLENIQDMTGIGILSRATGRSLINEQGILAPRSDIEEIPSEQLSRQYRTGLNAITGLKWTEWSKWYTTAKRERTERQNKQLEDLQQRLLGNQ